MTLKQFKKETGFVLGDVFGNGSSTYQKVRSAMLTGKMTEQMRGEVYEALQKAARERLAKTEAVLSWRFPEDR